MPSISTGRPSSAITTLRSTSTASSSPSRKKKVSGSIRTAVSTSAKLCSGWIAPRWPPAARTPDMTALGSPPAQWATMAPRRSAPPAETSMATEAIALSGTASSTRSAPRAARLLSPTTSPAPIRLTASWAERRLGLQTAAMS